MFQHLFEYMKEGKQNNNQCDSDSCESSSDNQGGNKRKVREDYRVKYAYLDCVSSPDVNGLTYMARDIQGGTEILKHSYLAIVNSLVILGERRKKRFQKQQQQQQQQQRLNPQASDAEVPQTQSSFINQKVADNFINSDRELLSSYSDTYEWSIEKFCDSNTRQNEFKRLFRDSEIFVSHVEKVRKCQEPINMPKFNAMVRKGKSLLGIIELLNSNYHNNFMDVFRLS